MSSCCTIALPSLPASKSHHISCLDFSFLSSEDSNLLLYPKLHACKSVKELKQIHCCIIKSSQFLQSHQLFYSKILSLFPSIAKSSDADLSYALTLFAQLHDPDVNICNSIIRSFLGSKSNWNCQAVLLFYRVFVEKGLIADSYTYPFVFKACTQLCDLRVGKMVHAHVVKNKFVLDLYVINTLMRLYAVCGAVEDVRKVFDRSPNRDVVSWTTLIQGYVDNGYSRKGLDLFSDMCKLGYKADEKMLVVVISACAKLRDLSLGRKLHEYICSQLTGFDVFVGNALVDMYLKCGDATAASYVFNAMPVKNVVSWNSMIAGLAQKGDYKEALGVFEEMQDCGVMLDDVTLVAVLHSCTNLGMLEMGKWVHAYLNKNRIEADGIIGNALIDMYAKCGNIVGALGVFEAMKVRDVYTYTVAISGLAMHGDGVRALGLFSEMLQIGIEPNEVTFVGILTACCHMGLVEEGRKYFADMSRLFNLKPQMEHYGCMVDLFSRAGLISEALEFIEKMPLEPDALIWGALLGGCRIHGKVELGESALNQLARIAQDDDGAHVLMSNIYASASKWKESKRLRKLMKLKKLQKNPGCSSIELDGVVHEFIKGHKTNPSTEGIYMALDNMSGHIGEAF